MSKETILSSKMMAAIANVSPTDYTGQLAVMLSVLGDNLAECMHAQLSDAKAGQVYARPHQIAERWGYTAAFPYIQPSSLTGRGFFLSSVSTTAPDTPQPLSAAAPRKSLSIAGCR